MRINKELNLEQTEKLFRDNAIMIGGRDYVPTDTAEKLLGRNAVKYANKLGEDYNCYSTGELGGFKEIVYLTKNGFIKAVTFKNIMIHNSMSE